MQRFVETMRLRKLEQSLELLTDPSKILLLNSCFPQSIAKPNAVDTTKAGQCSALFALLGWEQMVLAGVLLAVSLCIPSAERFHMSFAV